MSDLKEFREQIKALLESDDLVGNLVKEGMNANVAKAVSKSKGLEAAKKHQVE